MKILTVDAFSGAAGDMLLGALVDAGADLAAIEAGLRTLPLGGWALGAERTRRGSIAATKVRVKLDALAGGEEGYHTAHLHGAALGAAREVVAWRRDAADVGEARKGSAREGRHGDGHGHGHDHGHAHGHDHDHGPARGATPHTGPHVHGRTPAEIFAILRASRLPEPVVARCCDVFGALAAAEAQVHGMTPETVHFHEVGAVDAVVDICGTVYALWLLGVERIYATSVTTGFGTVRCAHGVLPVPGPATLNLLVGVPTRPGDLEEELLTPTGAALLKTLVTEWRPAPSHRVLKVGYGAGSSDWPDRPNVVRVTLGDVAAAPADATPQVVVEVEFEVDDMRPQQLAFLRERLELAGALDVSIVPVQMKKGRSGHRVLVLAAPERSDAVEEAVFRDSTTFGFRRRTTERRTLDRAFETVETPFGPCRVKIGRRRGEIVRVRPEYEDVAELARRAGRPVETMEALVLDFLRARA